MHTPEIASIHARCTRRRAALMALPYLAVLALGQHALAHHGWAWAEDAQSTLTGKVLSVSMSAPHPTLQVTDADGAIWQVDLGNPSQTQRSGFTAESASAGVAITVLGNRNRDHERKHMKAVRVTIDGKSFDMYPERIRSN